MKNLLPLLGIALCTYSANAQEQRVPLFEIFTSATCPPCNPANSHYEGIVAGKPRQEFVCVKYQLPAPGAGDPYTTNDGYNKAVYYGVTSIPWMQIDGGWSKNAALFTSGLYDQSRAVPAQFKLSGTYAVDVNTKEVTVNINYTPLDTAVLKKGARLYVAIIENNTAKNKKSNGETEFFNVVKKMLPSNAGTSLTGLEANVEKTFNTTFTFKGEYRLPKDGQPANRIKDASEHSVEDFANLRVVAWVQASNKEVYQAANLTSNTTGIKQVSQTISSYSVYPNPATNTVNVRMEAKERDEVSVTIITMNGAVVAQQAKTVTVGTNEISMSIPDLANGFYNIILADSKGNSFVEKLSVFH